jgi:hypothetical protein
MPKPNKASTNYSCKRYLNLLAKDTNLDNTQMQILPKLGVDNGPDWVGMGPKPPSGPIHGWGILAQTEPLLGFGLNGFGLDGSRVKWVGSNGFIQAKKN